MVRRQTWRELRAAEQPDSPAYRAAYERARRAGELGAKVRSMREERGLSQMELARCMGWKQSALARLELGGAEPRLNTLDEVAAALDMDVVVDFRPHRLSELPA